MQLRKEGSHTSAVILMVEVGGGGDDGGGGGDREMEMEVVVSW